jgi:hypothetical protein
MVSAGAKSLYNYKFSKTYEMVDSEFSLMPDYILFLATLGNIKEEGGSGSVA